MGDGQKTVRIESECPNCNATCEHWAEAEFVECKFCGTIFWLEDGEPVMKDEVPQAPNKGRR